MKRLKILFVLSLLNLIAITTVAFLKLPQIVPIHANIYGVFDSFAPRWVVPLFGLVAPVLAICMMLYRKRTQDNEKTARNRRVEDVVFSLLIIFFGGLAWLAVAMGMAAPDTSLPYELLVGLPLGFLMIILSNFDGVIKQNRWLGVRTKWTLANEEVWRKTHRRSGYSGVFGGICIIAGVLAAHFTGWMPFALIGFLIGIIFVAIYPTVYSYLVYQKIEKQ